jgi:hypothetical protein
MMLSIMKLASQTRGTVSLIASMFTLLAGTCLRWRHIQRAHLYDTTANAAIFWIAKGKTCKGGARHPFLSPSPRYWFQQDVSNRYKTTDVIAFWANQEKLRKKEELHESGSKYPYLFPKVPVQKHEGMEFVLSPDSTTCNKPMSYPEANIMLRALLVEAGVPEEKAATYTIKSLRKFLPTAASIWQLSPEAQNAIGDWQTLQGAKVLEAPAPESPCHRLTARPKLTQPTGPNHNW